MSHRVRESRPRIILGILLYVTPKPVSSDVPLDISGRKNAMLVRREGARKKCDIIICIAPSTMQSMSGLSELSSGSVMSPEEPKITDGYVHKEYGGHKLSLYAVLQIACFTEREVMGYKIHSKGV